MSTPKLSKTQAETLVQLRAAEMHGDATVPAERFRGPTLDKLAELGLVEQRVCLTSEGRTEAHLIISPEPGVA